MKGTVFELLPSATVQNERGDIGFADMAGVVEAVDGAEFNGGFCVADRGSFMDDGYAGFFKFIDDGAGVVACGLDDLDFLGVNDLDDGGIVGGFQGMEKRVRITPNGLSVRDLVFLISAR